MSYVYIRSEPYLWTVGFYRPDGTWEPESDHDSATDAALRVNYLNGGPPAPEPPLLTSLDSDDYNDQAEYLTRVRHDSGEAL